MWAKWAIDPIEAEVRPKNKSIRIKAGTKNFAFMGTGGNINISFVLGNINENATTIPYIAPDAPIIGVLKSLYADNIFDSETNSRM